MNHLITNMVPFLGQASRLMPNIDTDRTANSWLSYLGIPVAQVTPSMQAGEVANRQRQIDALRNAATNLGYTP
jgi:hypothetical protein